MDKGIEAANQDLEQVRRDRELGRREAALRLAMGPMLPPVPEVLGLRLCVAQALESYLLTGSAREATKVLEQQLARMKAEAPPEIAVARPGARI